MIQVSIRTRIIGYIFIFDTHFFLKSRMYSSMKSINTYHCPALKPSELTTRKETETGNKKEN